MTTVDLINGGPRISVEFPPVITGPAGQGVPPGGTIGQALRKASGADYDAEWVTDPTFITQAFDTNDLVTGWEHGLRRFRGAPGAVFTLDEELFSSDNDVYLDFSGCTFVQNGTDRLFRLDGLYSAEQIVSASTSTTTVVSNGAAYAIGDVLKKASFGVLCPYAQDQAGEKGESIVITSISSNTLTHAATMFDYSTVDDVNVRVAKFSGVKTYVNIGTITGPAVEPGTVSACLRLESLLDVDVVIGQALDTFSTILDTQSLYGGRVGLGGVRYVKSGVNLHYGISEHGSQEVKFEMGHGRQVRHFFTATAAGNGVPGSFGNAGTSARNTILNGSCEGSEIACWDSHHGPYNNRYVGLRSKPAPAGHNYTSRGVGLEFLNCEAEGGQRGLQAIIQEGFSGTLSPVALTRLHNAMFRNQRAQWVYGEPTVNQIYVRGGWFEVDDGILRGIMMFFENDIAIVTAARIVFRAACSSTNGLIRSTGTCDQLEVTDTLFDIVGSDFSSSDDRGLIVASNASGKVICEDIRVKNNISDQLPHFFRGSLDRSVSRFGNITIDYLEVGFFDDTQFLLSDIETANMITGPIRVLSGAVLDVDKRAKDYTRYIDPNVGAQVWTGVTSAAVASGAYAELADSWFCGPAGATTTFARSTDVPAGSEAPFSIKATAAASTTSMRWTKRLLAVEAKAILSSAVLCAWVKAVAGQTITLALAECDVADVFTNVTTRTSTTFTATGDWQELSWGTMPASTSFDLGCNIRIIVTATAAGQEAFVTAVGLAKGIIPPLFQLAPYSIDALRA